MISCSDVDDVALRIDGKIVGDRDIRTGPPFHPTSQFGHCIDIRYSRDITVHGSGTISNYDRSLGSCCLAEVRMLETVAQGKPSTPFMSFGDRVRIEMLDGQGRSIFGAIDQQVVRTS